VRIDVGISYVKNRNGFTLIEMLLVLFMVLLTSSIVFQLSLKVSEKRIVDQFFQQLILDIQEMQALAIEKEQTVNFQFYNSNRYVAYQGLNSNLLLDKDFPKNINFNIYSNLKRFRINPSGDVADFGTLQFDTPFGQVDLIIYIKEGRIRLVEY